VVGYEVFGLKENPYAITPLTPFAPVPDGRLPLELDGFVDLGSLRDYLRECVDAKRPAFVIVSGRNYTGRTSMGFCAIDLYRKLCGLGDRFLVGEVGLLNYSPFEMMSNAFSFLHVACEERELALTEQLRDRLRDVESTPPMTYQPRLQVLAKKLGIELAKQEGAPYGFGVLIEGLREIEILQAARVIFKATPSIVVFTHSVGDNATTAPLSGLTPDEAHIMHLSPLASRQVRLLAEGRWKQATTEHRCPFDGHGLETVFGTETFVIRRALKKLHRLLEYRLRVSNGETPPTDPEALHMSYDWLVETVRAMNEWNRE
jgi:hypothetical protein